MQIINDLTNLPPIWAPDEETHHVFMDDGYDQMKVGYWADVDGKRTLVAFKYRTSVQMGRHLTAVMGSETGIYIIDGSSYTVSEYVENDATRNKRFAHSDFKIALVHHGLKVAGFGGKNVHIHTTLPISHFFRDGLPDADHINKVKTKFKAEAASADGEQLALIVGHTIQSEAVAAFIAYMLRNGHENVEPIPGAIGVCDIGGNTTDLTVLVPGQQVMINHDLSSSREVGVLNIKDDLKKRIQHRFGFDKIPSATISQALDVKKLTFLKQEHDIAEDVKMSKVDTAKRVLNVIDEILGDQVLHLMLFCGGGTECLKTELAEEYPTFESSDFPEFDNLLGLVRANEAA
ncbi:MAG: ParM/StbA family protein [Alteromonas stellipolaris]|uniref:plasmid segregation protein ParM domain-containing protein n=1 Tax=Alteromonas stellipolaris TaxID=233316 RepID=UPI003B8AB7EA